MAEPKPTTEEVLKLAREIVSYSESNLAKNIGACQPGTFGFKALTVGQALIDRLEPVKLLRPRECFSVECDACHEGEVFPSDNFCPNCGKAIQWK